MGNNKQPSLKKNYFYNFINQILVLIIPLITTPYLARVLGEEGNGQYSFSFSIITYFILFANLGFNTYGQREIAKNRDDKAKKSQTFWEIVILRAFFTFSSLIILYSIGFTIGYGIVYTKLILILSIHVIAVVFDIQFLYQGEEDFKSISIRTIILKLIGMVCIFIFVKERDDTWIYALCLSIATLFSNVIMWPGIIDRIEKVKISDLCLRKHFLPAFVIFLPTLAVTIYSVLDKTMIGLLSSGNSDYENGCYDQAYKINSIALLLVTVISPIMIPRNSSDYSKGNMEEIKKHIEFSCNYVWLLSIPLLLGFFVLSKNLSTWFLGDGYDEVPILLQIMAIRFIASGFIEVFGYQYFIVIGKEKITTIATIVAAIVNFSLNFLLIPVYGAIGAAITTAISEVLVFLVLSFFFFKQKIISFRFFLIRSVKNILAAIIMFISIFFMQKNMDLSLLSFVLITLVGGTIYFLMLWILRDSFFISLKDKVIYSIKSKIKK